MSIDIIQNLLEKEQEKESKKAASDIENLANKIITKAGIIAKAEVHAEGSENELHDLILLAEQLYYKAAYMNWSIKDQNAVTKTELDTAELITKYTNDKYSITGSKEQGYSITIPFVPKRFVERKTVSAKIIGAILKATVSDFLKRSNEHLPVYEKAHAAFTVFIGNDIPFASVPDGDNLDLKHIIDAMATLLYPNDNILSFTYSINGKTTSAASYIQIDIAKAEP